MLSSNSLCSGNLVVSNSNNTCAVYLSSLGLTVGTSKHLVFSFNTSTNALNLSLSAADGSGSRTISVVKKISGLASQLTMLDVDDDDFEQVF